MIFEGWKQGILPSVLLEEPWEYACILLEETKIELEDRLINMWANDPSFKNASDLFGGKKTIRG